MWYLFALGGIIKATPFPEGGYAIFMLAQKKNLAVIIFAFWLPLALLMTLVSLMIYGAVQQDLRQSANDPQIQMAEDAARALASGKSPATLVEVETVDIATSLAPYLIIFDSAGQPVASSAQLNGQTPALPNGVFDFVRQQGEDRVTWQPQSDVRSATIIVPYRGSNEGFVLAGRSLREVEKREDQLTNNLALGWIVSLTALFVTVTFCVVIGARLISKNADGSAR